MSPKTVSGSNSNLEEGIVGLDWRRVGNFLFPGDGIARGGSWEVNKRVPDLLMGALRSMNDRVMTSKYCHADLLPKLSSNTNVCPHVKHTGSDGHTINAHTRTVTFLLFTY